MSKKAKEQSKLKRLNEKRKKKMAQQAQYVTWAADGRNTKSRRHKMAVKKSKNQVADRKHEVLFCGNIGCSRCFEEINSPRNALPGSCIYRKQFMPRAKVNQER